MANKQVNELEALSNPDVDDTVPVYNNDSTSTERIKKVTVSNVLTPEWSPYTGIAASPSVNVINGISVSLTNVGAPESDVYAAISAADFIISIKENNNPPYLFGLNRVGDAPSVIYSDPRDAILLLDCNDFSSGLVTVEVWIQDASSISTYTETYVIVNDPDSLCVAP